MLVNALSSFDYSAEGAWERLADLLAHQFAPQPSPNCGRVRCEPGWQWQPRLSDYDIWLAVQGRGAMQIGGESYPICPGALFMLRPGDTGLATQRLDDRLTVVYLHLDLLTPDRRAPASIDGAWLPARYVPFQDASEIDALLTRIVRLMESRRSLALAEARFALGQALVMIYQQDAANQGAAPAQLDRRVELVAACLRSQPERRLSLAEAAALAGLAPDYFSQLFSREMGVSFRSFAIRTRLERARHLLEETDMPIGQIALSLGYADVFLFSRQFKQHFGLAPSLVRRR